MTARPKSTFPAPPPWSVKGVDRDIRAAAKQMAHGAGMTLGAWLSRLILDAASARRRPGRAPEQPAEAPALHTIMDDIRRLTSQIEEAEARAQPAGAAVAPLSRRVAQLSRRLEALHRSNDGDCRPLDQAKADISDRLRRLEDPRSAPHRQGVLFTPSEPPRG